MRIPGQRLTPVGAKRGKARAFDTGLWASSFADSNTGSSRSLCLEDIAPPLRTREQLSYTSGTQLGNLYSCSRRPTVSATVTTGPGEKKRKPPTETILG